MKGCKYIIDKVGGQTQDPSAVRGRLYLHQVEANRIRAQKKMVEIKRKQDQERQDNPREEEDIDEVQKVVTAWLKSRERKDFYKASKEKFERLSLAKARNFLVLELLIESVGPRPEVLRHLTVEHVSRAKETEEGVYVTVTRHKTGSVGAAYVTINDRQLWKALLAFIRYKRPEITDDESGYVFLGVNRGQKRPEVMGSAKPAIELLNEYAQTELGLADFRATPKSIRRLWSTLGADCVR